jgi:hypothetical protein
MVSPHTMTAPSSRVHALRACCAAKKPTRYGGPLIVTLPVLALYAKNGLVHRSKYRRYSITSSARQAFETGLRHACFDLSDGGA